MIWLVIFGVILFIFFIMVIFAVLNVSSKLDDKIEMLEHDLQNYDLEDKNNEQPNG